MKNFTFLTAGLTAGILVTSLVVAGCSITGKPGKQATRAEQVKIGYYGGTCEAPVYIAQEKGIFKQKGLEVELVKIDFETLKVGVATGKIDAVMADASLLKPIEQGLDIKITDGMHTGCIQTVVPINSAIQSVKDFKGKNIGVDAIGGWPMTLLSIVLKKNGLDPKTDVTWKAFPEPQLVQALEKGEIDLFSTWDPFGQLALNDKKARRIISNTHTPPYKDYYCCFVGINGRLVKDRPEVAKTITEAFQEASIWVEQNPKEAARVSIEKKYTTGDPVVSSQLLADYKYEPNPAKARESLDFYLKNLKDLQILEQSTDPDQLLQDIFVDLFK